MLARLARFLRRPVIPVLAVPEAPAVDTVWCRKRREHSCLYVNISTRVLEMLPDAHQDRVHATIRAAERILKHEFDLLGSGCFRPIDPDRPTRNGYSPIDWYLDPVRC